MAKAHNYNIIGNELSDSPIEYAKKNGISVIKSLDEEPHAFDYIYANQVFEHLEDPATVLKELVHVLSPRGIIHIKVPSSFFLEPRLTKSTWKPSHDAIHPSNTLIHSIENLSLLSQMHAVSN